MPHVFWVGLELVTSHSRLCCTLELFDGENTHRWAIQSPGAAREGMSPWLGGNQGHGESRRLELSSWGYHCSWLLRLKQPPPCTQHLLSFSSTVPPSKPTVNIPSSATIGNRAVLTCSEQDGSPPSEYTWFKDGIVMPTNPKSTRAFSNSSYVLNPTTGELVWMGWW